MQYGVLAGNLTINSRIYAMLEQIDAADVPKFVRKLQSERDEQRFHTFRELVGGSHLQSSGMAARYAQINQGAVPM